MSNYNAVLILEAIAKAPIPDEVKLKAVNDINRMYKDKAYLLKCIGSIDCKMYDLPSVDLHHSWCNSDLGADFWYKIFSIIDA